MQIKCGKFDIFYTYMFIVADQQHLPIVTYHGLRIMEDDWFDHHVC